MSSWALVLVISLVVVFGLMLTMAVRRSPRRRGADGYVAGANGVWDSGQHHHHGHHGGGDYGGGHHGGGDFGGGGGGGHH